MCFGQLVRWGSTSNGPVAKSKGVHLVDNLFAAFLAWRFAGHRLGLPVHLHPPVIGRIANSLASFADESTELTRHPFGASNEKLIPFVPTSDNAIRSGLPDFNVNFCAFGTDRPYPHFDLIEIGDFNGRQSFKVPRKARL